ncbi:MAG: HlyD family efflux transporter periplasmic adaptor subunit [Ruminococcaceae bacterium]|nr:HlyD family efflux transporter periplasmic adaptor subunit [Oscillospiraceae bacterium]
MSKHMFRRACAALLCLCVGAGVIGLSGCGSEVKTYAVSDIAYVDDWLSNSESYGEVSTYNIQTVFGSDTMKVQRIHVSEGDEVKKGDRLISYDTSLTQIELDKKELEVMELELALRQAEQELKTVNSYKPMVVTTIVPDVSASDLVGTEVSGFAQIGGSGERDDPFIFVVEDGKIPCSDTFFNGICPPGSDDVWVVFQERNENMTNGVILEHWGIRYRTSVSGMYMSFFDSSEFSVNKPTEPYEEIEFNSGLTAAEISRLRDAAKKRIEEADLEYRVAELEYKQMQLEVDSGVITAELDGVVEFVTGDIDLACENYDPLLKVSDDGGYVVQGTLSELELGTVTVGQTVKVTSWEHYAEYEAQITDIATVPAAQNGWTNGNTNVSYYPFTVYIDGSADLMENEFVSVTYNSKGNLDSGFYIERAFVLDEDGRSYVFVQTEDGTVEKRRIVTGEYLWGNYVRIVSGLTVEDRIAFPYDKEAKDGAVAIEATIDELYAY